MKKSLQIKISLISSFYIIIMAIICYLSYKYLSGTAFLFTLLVSAVLLIVTALIIAGHLAGYYSKPLILLKEDILKVKAGDTQAEWHQDSIYEYGEIAKMLNELYESYNYNIKKLTDSINALSLTEQKLENKASQVRHISNHDILTGLYNRTTFIKRANSILKEHSETLEKFAIIYIDVDNFKNINDTFGHIQGDLLLVKIAETLLHFVNNNSQDSTDILARTGGDEFIILKNTVTSKKDLTDYADNLIKALCITYDLDDSSVNVSVSIGISLFPYDGLSINELIKDADIAMYVAKDSGKSKYEMFNSEMEDAFNRKVGLKTLLSDVIEKNNIYLQYQAQADLNTGSIINFEALMRIKSDNSENIRPSEFIPIAENSGIIAELGEWALLEACSFNKKLMDMGYGPFRVAVNVSTDQLKEKNFIDTIKSVPEKTGLSLKYLEIEITESVLMEEFKSNLKTITMIKELGARVALDDFGTCYSSFNYLTHLPVDVIKIDKSFIDGICTNEKDTYITESMISLAHKLNMTVVAEGVENVDQLKILQEQHCDTIQGYLLSKPLSEEDFIDFIEKNK